MNISRQQWVVLLLVGLLLAVAALPVSHEEQKERRDAGGMDLNAAAEDEDKNQLEDKLESLLSSVEGVGRVQVILMTDEKKDAGGFYVSGTPQVTGVLIAAEGAGNSLVVREIQEAVKALFQVEPHKIKVMRMK